MNRLWDRTNCIIAACIAVIILAAPLFAQESSSDSSWNKAQAEMKAMFGQVPVEFTKMPDYLRGITWEWFKANANPNSAIPRKYMELIGLAVAAQIPCNYCVYIHTKQAKMFGATDEEIREAISEGALTRYMSTMSNGDQLDFDSFKAQWDKIFSYVQTHEENK